MARAAWRAVVCGLGLLALYPGSVQTQSSALPAPVLFVSRAIPNEGSIYWDTPRGLPGVGAYSRLQVATPGRLQIRETNGTIRTLVNGASPTAASLNLIDVSSADVSYDGQRIVFAGIRSGSYSSGPVGNPDAWRIYAINVDGSGLQQLTFNEGSRGDLMGGLQAIDDFDPAWLPDGRIVFSSTRWPAWGHYGGVRTSNLYVMNADGTNLHRITAERNGADRPVVDPVTGKIVFARWWRNHRFALDDMGTQTTSTGYRIKDGLSSERGLQLTGSGSFGDFLWRNAWQIATIRPDGTELAMWGGATGNRVDDERNHVYGGAFGLNGEFFANYFPMYNMTEAAGFGGIRRFPRGPQGYTPVIGVTVLSQNYVSQNPPSYGILVGNYATDPVALPDGRLLVSWAQDVNQDYGLYTINADGSGRTLVHNVAGTTEIRAKLVAPRALPPVLNDTVPTSASLRQPSATTAAGPFDGDGTFVFDALNVYFNGPVDADIVNAPQVGSASSIRFFIDHQRSSPGSFPERDWPILLKELPVAKNGTVRDGAAPANVPLFEQLRSANGRVPLTGRRDDPTGAAHVAGHNYGRPGAVARCVGCHAGHTMIPVPANPADAQWTNLAPGATITVSSTRDSSQNGGLTDRRVMKGEIWRYWNSANGQYQNQWVQLTFPVPIMVRTVRLYNPRSGGDANSSIQVPSATVRLYADANATQQVAQNSAGALSVSGTNVDFTPVVARVVRVEIGATTGTFYGSRLAALAEVEVIANADDGATGPPPCSFTVSPLTHSVGSAAGSAATSVTTANGCGWTASTTANWIAIASGASGSGNGTVNLSVAANTTTSARSGQVTVAGQTVTVNQSGVSCAFTVSPASATAPQGGSTASVSVSANSACSWSAQSNDAWITVPNGTGATGSGTASYTTSANTTSSTRVGTISVAGQTVTITQAGVPCSIAVTPTSASVPQGGGTGSVSITTGCGWSASSGSNWLTITSATSGTGSATLNYSATANTSTSARSATISVGGQSVTINQPGVSCSFTVTPTTFSISSAATSVSVGVGSPGGCGWSASTSTAWLSIASGAAGSANGTVTVNVQANPTSSSRTGTVTVAGQAVRITQGGTSCTYTVAPTSATAPQAGGAASVALTAAAGCAWTAGEDTSWISITSATSGSGSATVNYSTTANTSYAQRTGTITVGGRTVTVTQPGLSCTYTVTPTSLSVAAAGGSPSVAVAGPTACNWSASSAPSWITVSPATGFGNGSVTLTVAANSGKSQRTGTVTVAGRAVSVTQLGQTQGRRRHNKYFAEGATGTFFTTQLALLNPETAATDVTIRFQKNKGGVILHGLRLGAGARATVEVNKIAGLESAEFATIIESDTPVVADRTMTWDASGYGSQAESGLPSAGPTWYFAEGATHSGFQLFYLLQNPNPTDTTVRVRFLLPSGAPVERTYSIDGESRYTIWVNQADPRLASTDVSAVIESLDGDEIIAERAMYLNAGGQTFRAGHESAGVSAPSPSWFLAEGATGNFFDMFLLLANPTAQAAQVKVTYLRSAGAPLEKSYAIPANSRFNIWVDEETFPGGKLLANADVSATVTSTNGVPIVAERAMWWPGPTSATWQEAHNSPGSTTTGTKWGLAEGEVGGASNLETYVLLANTADRVASVRVNVHFEDGTIVNRTYSVPSQSRFNVSMSADFPGVRGRRFGVVVESVGTNPAPIVVERAMYSDSAGIHWAAGTHAGGTKLQ